MIKIAYCAAWANGVCRDSAHSALFEESSLESLRRLIRRVECLVIGVNAYRMLVEKKFNFGAAKMIILSKNSPGLSQEGLHVVASPTDALNHFTSINALNVLIAGGISTISTFMEHGLVDEFIMDFEPALTPKAEALFPNLPRRMNLELIGMRKIGAATIQMHYRILS